MRCYQIKSGPTRAYLRRVRKKQVRLREWSFPQPCKHNGTGFSRKGQPDAVKDVQLVCGGQVAERGLPIAGVDVAGSVGAEGKVVHFPTRAARGSSQLRRQFCLKHDQHFKASLSYNYLRFLQWK